MYQLLVGVRSWARLWMSRSMKTQLIYMLWGKRRPRLGEPVRAESSTREDVARRPQANMLIDDLFSANDGWWWAKRIDRGGPGHDLLETAQRVCYGQTNVLYGWVSDLPTATFPQVCTWSTVPIAMLTEVCFRELSYVSVPTSKHVPWMLLRVLFFAALFSY